MDYESYTRVHLVPAFGALELEAITIELIEEFIAAKRREGKAVKSILNYLGLLHAIFAFGVRRGWCARNPSRSSTSREADATSTSAFWTYTSSRRFRCDPDRRKRHNRACAVPDRGDDGLRRGELLDARWQDIDWTAGVVRVRRNYTRGRFGTPKSRRSSRAVPLAERVRDELRLHYEGSRFQARPTLSSATRNSV